MDTGNYDLLDSPAVPTSSSLVEFHEPTGTYRALFDSREQPASEAVVSAVAVAAGTDPMDLPPVHDDLDPEALNQLFASARVRTGGFDGSVSFEYADYGVTVNSHGSIEVELPRQGRDTDAN